MGRISRDALAHAIAGVDAMTTPQQEDFADEIIKAQPNMFSSILTLRKMGVPADRMEFPVKMLLVCFQAMKESGKPSLSCHLINFTNQAKKSPAGKAGS